MVQCMLLRTGLSAILFPFSILGADEDGQEQQAYHIVRHFGVAGEYLGPAFCAQGGDRSHFEASRSASSERTVTGSLKNVV